jgi:hypothetical protein
VEHLENRRLLSGGYTFDPASSNAIAMDSNGKLYVAYYDTSAKNLKYAIREANGTWSVSAGTLDASSADVGLSVAMDLDSSGNPGVVYTDSYNADLRYAHWNGSGWDKQTVGGTTGKLGYYPSLRYLNDKPTISHFVRTSPSGSASTGYLRVDQGSSVNPPSTGWTTNTQIDTSGDAGRFSSIRYNSITSKWGVSYDDDVNVVAKFAESSISSITSTWSKTLIPVPTGASASGAFWTSLVYDSSGRPAFAYYDNASNNLNLDVAYRNGSGSTWTNTIVDSHNTTGKYPNLLIESGTFRVAYYDQTEKTVEVQSSTNGTTWTRDADLVTGAGSELKAIRGGGVWTFAWQDDGGAVHVNNDKTGQDWTQTSTGNVFGGRSLHASVVFDPGDAQNPGEQMWVIGGQTGSLKHNDVYASADGVNWRAVHADGDPGFSARTAHAALVFDNGDSANPGTKMWVIGGQTGSSDSTDVGDVWWSLDGQAWSQMLDGNGAAVSVGARRGHAAVVYNGKMYVIGGVAADGSPAASVMSSSDGRSWTSESGIGTLANRYGATAVVYDGSLYVFGGTGIGSTPNVATYRFDGTSWTAVGTPSNVNLLAAGGAGLVYDDKMWYLAGHSYWSTDGLYWNQAPDDPDNSSPFVDGRINYSAFAFAKANDGTRIWLIGGYVSLGQSSKSDVWSSD